MMNRKVNANNLRTFTEQVFQVVGVLREDAETAAAVMIEANLCGVDSHGVRMLPGFITLIRNGKINPRGQIKVIKETPVIAHLDGNLALGSVVGVHAMQMAVEKAKTSGVGLILVRSSTHWGRPAYYSTLAARRGCIGICFVNTESNMPPWGAKDPRIGNNPLSIGAPRASGEPVVLDMAMSQAAWSKIVMYSQEARKVPLGWGLDEEGRPTDDPAAILKSKRMVPMGQHKGSGLSLMIDIMTGILSGGKYCGELSEEGKGQPWATGYSQAFIAIDIASFIPLNEFQRRVDELVTYVKGAQTAEGFSEITIPGERAWRERALRDKNGIPLDEITLGELRTLANQSGVPILIGAQD
jgi:LDH2 family malate/lactate/ureidoglycolate dehydrogenase